jgi:molybdopterin-guanine dinucleotide biosynthesis protein A
MGTPKYVFFKQRFKINDFIIIFPTNLFFFQSPIRFPFQRKGFEQSVDLSSLSRSKLELLLTYCIRVLYVIGCEIRMRKAMLGALILAGGKSKRFKRNKALIKLRNEPLLVHVIRRVMELTHEIVVVIGKKDESNAFTAVLPTAVRTVKDKMEGKGPLVGIVTGMEELTSKYALVLPCDSPFIKRKVLEYLIRKAKGVDAVIPRWPNGYVEPLHAVYRVVPSISAAKDALRNKELRITDMIKRLNKVIYVGVNEIKQYDNELISFFNINALEDLKRAYEKCIVA